jgi:hypothetical protein
MSDALNARTSPLVTSRTGRSPPATCSNHSRAPSTCGPVADVQRANDRTRWREAVDAVPAIEQREPCPHGVCTPLMYRSEVNRRERSIRIWSYEEKRGEWRARRESNPRPSASKCVRAGGDRVRPVTTPSYIPRTSSTSNRDRVGRAATTLDPQPAQKPAPRPPGRPHLPPPGWADGKGWFIPK